MIHVAAASFYDAVYTDAASHDVVVCEGVKSPVVRRLTRAYRWIKPERLGLVIQPAFDPQNASKVLGDLSREEFEKLWQSVHWKYRIFLTFMSGVTGFWQSRVSTRSSLGKELGTTDRLSRDEALSWDEGFEPIRQAILVQRDLALCGAVKDQIDTGSKTIAVIYGARHMDALTKFLKGEGFRPTGSEWMTVFTA